MAAMDAQQWILLLAAFAALIPAIPLTRLFLRTRISEYLLFCAVFLLSSLFSVTFVLALQTDLLIYWQLSFTARNLTYFLFFTHTIRMLWRNPPVKYAYTGVILYAIIQFMILFWSHNPDGSGAGLYTINGIEIFSSNFRLIANAFQLYVATFFFYGFLMVKVENPSRNVRYSRIVMMVLASLLVLSRAYRLIQNFGLIPPSESTEVLGSSLLVFGFLMIGGVFIFDPAAIMLSRVQLGGILIISESGLPITSLKFKESNINISPTLLGGIISAIDNVVGELALNSTGKMLREVDSTERSILIHMEENITFSLLTNDQSTSILKSSLKFFAREYMDKMGDRISQFKKRGNPIEAGHVYPLLRAAFPYTSGLTLQPWD